MIALARYIVIVGIVAFSVFPAFAASTTPAAHSVQDVKITDSADWHNIRQIFVAFDSGDYKSTIRICKQVLSGTINVKSRIAIEDLLIIACRRAFGYDRAMAEAKALQTDARTFRPNNQEELKMLEGIISDLKSSQVKVGSKQTKSKPGEAASEKAHVAEAAYRVAEIICQHCSDQEAIVTWRKVIVKYPGSKQDFVARVAVAAIYEKLNDLKNARKVWLRGAMFAPDSDFARLCVTQLVRLFTKDKAYSEGAQALLYLAKSNPKAKLASPALLEAAKLFRLAVDDKSALSAYWEVVRLAADDKAEAESIVAIKGILLEQKKPNDAISLMTQVISRHPKVETQARALLVLSELYRSQNKEDLEGKALLKLVNEYRETKAFADAKPVLAKMCEEYYKKADEYRNKGNRTREYDSLQIAFQLDNDEIRKGQTRLRMANALTALGRFNEAQAYLKEILADSSGASKSLREQAGYQQAATYCRIGDRKTAMTILKNLAANGESFVREKALLLIRGIEIREAAN